MCKARPWGRSSWDWLQSPSSARRTLVSERWLGSWWYAMCLVTQSCPTLCNPIDYSLPVSSVHRISQARILEWVAIPFSRGSSWHRDRIQVSCIAQWTRIWASSRRWWRTGKPGMLQSMGSQRVGHDWLTEQLLHCRWILYHLSYQGRVNSYFSPQVSPSYQIHKTVPSTVPSFSIPPKEWQFPVCLWGGLEMKTLFHDLGMILLC